MRKLFIVLASALMALSLASCGSSSLTNETNSFSQSESTGKPGLFSLLSPTQGAILDEVPSFSWSESENATRYCLEIASSENFVTNNSAYVYYKHDYISTTSYAISADLAQKDVTYYWRVTAYCGNSSTLCGNTLNFFLSAPDYDEVDFDLGEVSDWSIHEEGAPVDLSMNNTDFFGNDEKALSIDFVQEDTKPIGWIVITKTVELDTYGTDSLYLNFFYSGEDATAYIRLIDNDGEFWRHQISISNNSKQVCILPFAEFSQNTQLVTTNNFEFDYQHIKRMEIVFEQTWGDGVALISEVKCIKKSNYSDMFIDKLNFLDYDAAAWKAENGYDFGTDISEDGYEYTLHYDSAPNELNEVGFASKGYAFTKIYVQRFLDSGDTIKMSLKYSGSSSGNASFRVGDEDGDLWYFLLPLSSLSVDEYTTFYLPYACFASSYLGGNGKREFSFINMLQFGVTNTYGSGTLSFKDIEVVYKEDEDIDTGAMIVGNDGVIEDFESYKNVSEPYYKWSLSTKNKDEYIALNKLQAIGSNNTQCGTFTYKADMEAATYSLDIDAKNTDFAGISLWLKDASPKSDNADFSYLDHVSADIIIALTLTNGSLAYYEIKDTAKVWTEYSIPFSSFSFESGSGTIDSQSIATISLALSYIYFDKEGNLDPTYMMANPVYIDNIAFASNIEAYKETALEKAVTADEDDPSKATLENAESYASSEELLGKWNYGNDYEYNDLELSDDVSSKGGKHSLKMNYKSFTSVSYSLPLTISDTFGSSFKPKGLELDIKGDSKATVYINLYFLVNGSTYQVRRNIESNELMAPWTHYEVGFGTFDDYRSPSTASLTVNNIGGLYKISIGIVNSDYSSSAIYMDNIRFTNSISRSTDTSASID